MRLTCLAGTLLAPALAAGALLQASAAAETIPTPPQTGCPVGFPLLSLDELEAQGYVFAPDLDVNQDRHICGKPLNPVVQQMACATFPGGVCPVPVLYSVRDNDVAQF